MWPLIRTDCPENMLWPFIRTVLGRNTEFKQESLPEIICCILWHGPVMEFLTYLHYMYISNKKYVLLTWTYGKKLQNILAQFHISHFANIWSTSQEGYYQ